MVIMGLAMVQAVAAFMARAAAQAVAVFMARALRAIKAAIISNLAKVDNISNHPGIRVTQSS